MKLIEDKEWNPEENPSRPSFDNGDIDVTPPVNGGNDGGNDDGNDDGNVDDNTSKPNLFVRLIQIIINFFKKLFGLA